MIDNSIIANFMGWNISKSGKTMRIGKGIKSSARRLTDIRYNCSWDWLIPVVVKIRQIDFNLTMRKKDTVHYYGKWDDIIDKIDKSLLEPDIDCLYLKCIELIKLYNSSVMTKETHSYESWKAELIRVTASETNTNESEIKLNEEGAKSFYDEGWTPYYTFRETWGGDGEL